MMSGLPTWKNPKLNVMCTVFDYKIWNMQRKLGWPAETGHHLTRKCAEFEDSDYLHLDIGGEGYHTYGNGVVAGFNSAINVNDRKTCSQPPRANIPHLILVEGWETNPSYPFAGAFADYMTMQDAQLTPKNIDEFERCIRPGGEIGLWIDYSKAIQALADRLNTYVELKSWSEFESLGDFSIFSKKTIPVPGADYLIGFCMHENWFIIQSVTASGKMGFETDRGRWRFTYNALATFKIRGHTYVFAWSNDEHYWFIQEILPGGKLGRETDTGKFKLSYEVMTTAQIKGKTYLIAHSSDKKYLCIQELLKGGRLGKETFTKPNLSCDQVVPFTRDGQTYLLLVYKDGYEWEIVSLHDGGIGWQQTDHGKWLKPYVHIIVNVQGKPIVFAQNQSNHYWFLQPINEGGKMGSETDNADWKVSYPTLSTYTHGNSAYIFGQDSKSSRNWFIRKVLPDGKMAPETDHGSWNNAYENVRFYTQYK